MRNSSLQTFGLSIFIVLAFMVIGIGFMFGIDNPVPWIMIVVLAALPYIHKRISARHYLTWDDELSVGIQSIDDDHKKLIALINTLQTAIMYPSGENYERQALKEVVDYTIYHFKREEELMAKHGYPDYEPHKKTHAVMITKIGEYMEAYEKNSEGAICDLTKYLKTWLIKHIAGTDQQYCTFLNEKGVH
ncbi:MAG: hemerythrin family protein [Gammaproteobacteria bacterium]|nr:hemerythrin family protein [Gammaproteobacteria bacterium]